MLWLGHDCGSRFVHFSFSLHASGCWFHATRTSRRFSSMLFMTSIPIAGLPVQGAMMLHSSGAYALWTTCRFEEVETDWWMVMEEAIRVRVYFAWVWAYDVFSYCQLVDLRHPDKPPEREKEVERRSGRWEADECDWRRSTDMERHICEFWFWFRSYLCHSF
jgi:hypothetical protein